MGKKANKTGKKKKRISKHVLHSQQQQAESGSAAADSKEDGTNSSLPLKPTPNTQQPSKTKKREKRIKDPEEAAEYLQNWKDSKHNNGKSPNNVVWKFNKNTQSWLIRHMYEVDKVPKHEFGLLMEYLEGLQGDVTKSRIVADATRRARRYKEHAKKLEADKKKENDNSGADVSGDENVISSSNDDKQQSSGKDASMTQEELEYEEQRWRKLSEHDKRKEYKRARKVLDLIQR